MYNQKCLLVLEHFTRFSERVFIPDKKTRSLLKDFSTKGVLKEDLSELDELV